MNAEYHSPDTCQKCLAAEAAAEMLSDRGIPAVYESFDGSIRIEDGSCYWYFGTVNETWGADITRRHSDSPQDDEYIGHCVTMLDSDSEDPFAIAGAILDALNNGVGVEIYRD